MSRVHAGQIFTRLTVIGPVSPNRWGHPRSECYCSCGKTVIVCDSDLLRRDKSTKSCGCYSRNCTRQRNHENREVKHSRFRDLAGIKQRNGRLTAIKVVGFDEEFRHALWECRCDPELGGCGNLCIVRRGAFLDETTSSCGCRKRDSDSNRFGPNNPNFRHGLRERGTDRHEYEASLGAR
jgi:hypothetical protein